MSQIRKFFRKESAHSMRWGRTDRQANVTTLLVIFYKCFANNPKSLANLAFQCSKCMWEFITRNITYTNEGATICCHLYDLPNTNTRIYCNQLCSIFMLLIERHGVDRRVVYRLHIQVERQDDARRGKKRYYGALIILCTTRLTTRTVCFVFTTLRW
jgi:hypothetical protein